MVDYQNQEEIEAVVKGFESCITGKEDFKHRNHLTVAVWYLTKFSPPEALNRMRDSLFRFLDHHGVGRAKYHETLTIFWLQLVRELMAEIGKSDDLLETTNKVLEGLANPRLVSEYYSEALLSSGEAKRGWVEPDIKTIHEITRTDTN